MDRAFFTRETEGEATCTECSPHAVKIAVDLVIPETNDTPALLFHELRPPRVVRAGRPMRGAIDFDN